MADPFVFECSGLPPGGRVVAFEGTEEISAPFRYEIDLLMDADAELGDAVGATATLNIGSQVDPYRVHGIIGSVGVVEHLEEQDVYRVVLVPRIQSILGLDRHSRVFVGEAVPAIIQTLVREQGFAHEDCEFRLTSNYAPIDFICQYRESTLDFLTRRMEAEGIYFYFSHDDTRERLVIVDDKGQHAQSKLMVPYLTSDGLAAGNGLTRFRVARHAVPGRVRVEDYDYLRPALPVRGEAPVPGGGGGEIRLRGENVATPKDAGRIAKLRAEGIGARQTSFQGEGRLYGLHAGDFFTLSDHPRSRLDGDYLATRMVVRGHHAGGLEDWTKRRLLGGNGGDEVFHVEIEAIPASVQFRPALRTPTPIVHGMEAGVVDGQVDSDYAQLDEHGRYLVKFQFDEREGSGSQASARLRMMQPHAGSPEGMHFPLRKGTEVLVAFIGGDPDRPVIAGAVHNALNPSVVRSDNSTKNVIQTGGGNRIVMEDTEGKQYIHIASPHKKTFLHMGSPFNPQYHKVTATGGTALSFTDDISTSASQTDVQTIVGDSRITIIGRAQIVDTDPRGQEIQAITAPGFIVPGAGNATDTAINVILGKIKADAKTVYAAGKPADGSTAATPDAGSSATVVVDATGQTAASGTPTVSTTPGPTATAVTSAVSAALAAVDLAAGAPSQANTDSANTAIGKLQTAVNALLAAKVSAMVSDVGQAVTDLTTLSTDATNLVNASSPNAQPPPSPPPIDFAPDVATLWQPQVAAALAAMQQAQTLGQQANTDLSSSTLTNLPTIPTPFDPANPQNGISAAQSAIGLAKTAASDTTAAVTQVLAAAALTRTVVAAAPPPPTPGPPPLPNPNAPAIYNTLPHIDNQTPPQLQTIPDFTDKTTGKPMAIDAGSAFALPADAIANPNGVVNAGNDSTGLDPQGDVAAYPLHAGSDIKVVGGDNVTMVANDSRSQTYGHTHTLVGTASSPTGTTSWVHGNVESDIDGDQHTKVGDWTSPKEVTSEIHGLQSSAVYGEQNSLVTGARTTEIGGLDIFTCLGGKVSTVGPLNVSLVAGESVSVVAGTHQDVKLGTFTLFQTAPTQAFNLTIGIDVHGIHVHTKEAELTVKQSKFETTINSINDHITKLETVVNHITLASGTLTITAPMIVIM